MELKENIKEILEPLLLNNQLFIVDIKVIGSKIQPRVVVLLDSDEGIQIDQCGEISRLLGAEMEAKEIIASKYTLEVSSPGVDFPLIFFRQYQRHIGRTLMVKLNSGEQVTGKLTAVENDQITIIEDKKRKKTEEIIPIIFNFIDIKDAIVQISFK